MKPFTVIAKAGESLIALGEFGTIEDAKDYVTGRILSASQEACVLDLKTDKMYRISEVRICKSVIEVEERLDFIETEPKAVKKDGRGGKREGAGRKKNDQPMNGTVIPTSCRQTAILQSRAGSDQQSPES